MKKTLCAFLVVVASQIVVAQETDPLVISYFSQYEVKKGNTKIPWPMYYFSLDGYLAYDAVARMDDGRIVEVEATSASISKEKGGRDVYSGFPIRNNNPVARVCFLNFRVCTSRNITTCQPFGRNLFFEVDMNTGAAATNIPLSPDLPLPEGSDKFKVQLCAPVNLSS